MVKTSIQSSRCSDHLAIELHFGNSWRRRMPPYSMASVPPWYSMKMRLHISQPLPNYPPDHWVRLLYIDFGNQSTRKASNMFDKSQALMPFTLVAANQSRLIMECPVIK